MSDYNHSSRSFENMLRSLDKYDEPKSKTWLPSAKKLFQINSDESWKDYDTRRISIDKLIQDNDLDNPIALNNHPELWSPTGLEEDVDPTKFKYNPSLDNDIGSIIHGVEMPDGRIKLNDGRHRTRALKNAGYTHIVIPLKNELMARQHPAIFGDYRSTNLRTLNDLKRTMDMLYKNYNDVFNINPNEIQDIKKAIRNRIEYVKNKYGRY